MAAVLYCILLGDMTDVVWSLQGGLTAVLRWLLCGMTVVTGCHGCGNATPVGWNVWRNYCRVRVSASTLI